MTRLQPEPRDTTGVSLAISPCPNDTFAFFGLLNGKTDFKPDISCQFHDIQALNHACAQGELDFCKVSFFAFLQMLDTHIMLDSGAALGFGCGPLIVGNGLNQLDREVALTIAIPGKNTTAYLLLQLFIGKRSQPIRMIEMPFDQIMQAVSEGRVDAGLIIHESRFTFMDYNLKEWVDLGAWWEQATGRAIPLGGIVARRTLPTELIQKFQRALVQSINYAWREPDEVTAFMQEHAQEMNEEVMMKHVHLYVNDFTSSLGIKGRESIVFLYDEAKKAGLCPDSTTHLSLFTGP